MKVFSIVSIGVLLMSAIVMAGCFDAGSGTVTGTLVAKSGWEGIEHVLMFGDTAHSGHFISVTLENFTFTGDPIVKGIKNNTITIHNKENYIYFSVYNRLKVGLNYTVGYTIEEKYVDELNDNLVEKVWINSITRAD